MSRAKRKLLLIACSNRKVRTKRLLPAIERYDGVNYRVIRKAIREGYFPPNVDIKILSAKFGLIDAQTRIPYYDQRMTKGRVAELRLQVIGDLKQLMHKAKYIEAFINMGAVYLLALDGLGDIVGGSVRMKKAKGGIGSKSRSMKLWLLAAFKTQ